MVLRVALGKSLQTGKQPVKCARENAPTCAWHGRGDVYVTHSHSVTQSRCNPITHTTSSVGNKDP